MDDHLAEVVGVVAAVAGYDDLARFAEMAETVDIPQLAQGFARFGEVAFFEGVELFLFEKGEDGRLTAEPNLVIPRHAVQPAHPVIHAIERRGVRADLLRRNVRDEEKVSRFVELAAGKERYD